MSGISTGSGAGGLGTVTVKVCLASPSEFLAVTVMVRRSRTDRGHGDGVLRSLSTVTVATARLLVVAL